MKVLQAITAACLVIMMCVAASYAAAVSMTPSIHNPCLTNPNVEPLLPSTIDLLDSAVTATNAAKGPITILMEKISDDGLLTRSEYNSCVQVNSTPRGLPIAREATAVSVSNMAAILKQHFNHTSIHILYLQVAIDDQVNYDNGKYKDGLQNITSNLYACLCKAKMLLKSLKDDVTQYLDSGVVPANATNLQDDKMRYKRNLRLINQGKRLLRVHIANYGRMRNAMTTVG